MAETTRNRYRLGDTSIASRPFYLHLLKENTMAYNKKEVLQANTEAIRVVLRLEKERREATEAEKSILRNYQGFGGLKCVLNRTDNPDDIRYWSKSEQNLFEPTQQLKQMIYREAVDANTAKRYWESIKASVLTSFYTDTRIVSAISDALASTNLQVRRCLDPSMGMGAQLLKLNRKRLLQQSTLPEQPILLLTRFVIAFHEALTRFMDELQIQASFSRYHPLLSS